MGARTARLMPYSPSAAAVDTFNQQAASIVRSGKAAEAFDLSREPKKVRERYGRHRWGQSHLLARRLIERGSRFVTVDPQHDMPQAELV